MTVNHPAADAAGWEFKGRHPISIQTLAFGEKSGYSVGSLWGTNISMICIDREESLRGRDEP